MTWATSVGTVIHHVVPVAATPRLQERLLAAPDGPREVVHRGAHAIYVDLDGLCVGVVSAPATRVPCALWSTVPDLAAAGMVGAEASVSGRHLVVDGVHLRVARLVETRLTRLSSPGTDLPAEGALSPTDVDRLLGLGPGLTPLGDDVIAGWLLVRAAAGEPDPEVTDAVRRGLGRTTLFSATLLDCALHGEALPEVAAWLKTLGTHAESAATAALLGVGASSGAGLIAGARFALASLNHIRRAA